MINALKVSDGIQKAFDFVVFPAMRFAAGNSVKCSANVNDAPGCSKDGRQLLEMFKGDLAYIVESEDVLRR